MLKLLTPVLQPLYRQYLSRARSCRYKDVRVVVSPGVFFPGFIFSTKIFLQFIEGLDLNGKRFLELGAGSGLISIFAARKGAVVTASDINPLSVENIRENAARNDAAVTVIESDLFEGILLQAFDFIIIAPPYYPKDPADYREMAWFCGAHFEFFERLFRQLPVFFHDSSQVLMILSEDCDISAIRAVASRYGFEFHLLLRKRKLGEWNFIFRIGRNDLFLKHQGQE